MAVSKPDVSPHVQVPGFRDRLGERVIVPQPSGALLEYLYFADVLADAPFFAQALKYRVARLSSFAHSSYCRVRRVQQVAERGDRLALVSSHVAGRRLTEVLDVASHAKILPSTAGVLAAARQTMTAVALLHDFAPDGFHGALGPDRLVLTGEGRVVVTEHVLGTVMNQAVEAWGAPRLWKDLGVATNADPAFAQDGRRNDIVQVGLIVLAMLLGRPIGTDDYPDEISWLLRQATETAADGTRTPLGPELRLWLDRTLSLDDGGSYTTLLDAQVAFAELLRDERYTPSAAAWDSFVLVCETAATRIALPVAPPPAPVPEAAGKAAVDQPPPTLSTTSGDASSVTTLLSLENAEGAASAPSGQTAGESADPFNSWPSSLPSESAAAMLAKYSGVDLPLSSPSFSSEHSAQVTAPSRPIVAPTLPAPATVVTLFPTPAGPSAPSSMPPVIRYGGIGTARVEEDLGSDLEIAEQPSEADTAFDEALRKSDRRRASNRGFLTAAPVRRLLTLGALLAVATAAVVQGPRLWAIAFDAQHSSGQMTIASDPVGAAVSVDGQFRGRTPLTLTLAAGSHQLEVQDGGSIQSKTISIGAHQTLSEQMTFAGAHDVGGLAISTYPGRGRVTVDGVLKGPAPVNVSDLAAGSHTVKVETPLGVQEQDVMVEAGKVLPLAVQTVSWIKAVAPYELQVSETGRVLGTTGRSAVVLSPGRHHLEFSNTALGLKLNQDVESLPGQLAVVPLELPMGTMNLTCDQPAEVYVDGQSVGDTPVSGLTVSLGVHEVAFRNARNGQLRYKVTATLAGPVRLAAAFRK
jgi:PEGA domain